MRFSLIASLVIWAAIYLLSTDASATVEATDTNVEAMEEAYRAGYQAGVEAKLDACEQGDLRMSRFNAK